MKRKQKRRGSRKARKVPKGKRKPRIPRKYFGRSSELMLDTIIRQVIRVLRRERRKLKWLIAQEYVRTKKLPKKERELSEMDKLVLAYQIGALSNVLIAMEM